jgi:hypothetical protein
MTSPEKELLLSQMATVQPIGDIVPPHWDRILATEATGSVVAMRAARLLAHLVSWWKPIRDEHSQYLGLDSRFTGNFFGCSHNYLKGKFGWTTKQSLLAWRLLEDFKGEKLAERVIQPVLYATTGVCISSTFAVVYPDKIEALLGWRDSAKPQSANIRHYDALVDKQGNLLEADPVTGLPIGLKPKPVQLETIEEPIEALIEAIEEPVKAIAEPIKAIAEPVKAIEEPVKVIAEPIEEPIEALIEAPVDSELPWETIEEPIELNEESVKPVKVNEEPIVPPVKPVKPPPDMIVTTPTTRLPSETPVKVNTPPVKPIEEPVAKRKPIPAPIPAPKKPASSVRVMTREEMESVGEDLMNGRFNDYKDRGLYPIWRRSNKLNDYDPKVCETLKKSYTKRGIEIIPQQWLSIREKDGNWAGILAVLDNLGALHVSPQATVIERPPEQTESERLIGIISQRITILTASWARPQNIEKALSGLDILIQEANELGLGLEEELERIPAEQRAEWGL